MIVVHHLNNSRSQRVLWLLEELALPYEVQHYQRDPATLLAPAQLRLVHPLGKSPVIVDDGRTIAESAVILEYLLDQYGQGRLRPEPGSPERLRYQYWMHFAEGSAMPPLLLHLVFHRLQAAPMPFFARPIAKALAQKTLQTFVLPNVTRILAFLEAEMAKDDWFAGADFTAADIQMSFPLEAAQARVGLDPQFPRLKEWLGRIHARPAYQRALASGGPYALSG